jgi:hypothetical protein
MTPEEFRYIQRAVQELEREMTPIARIKVERTMSQILARSADLQEQVLVDSIEDRLYNTNIQTERV